MQFIHEDQLWRKVIAHFLQPEYLEKIYYLKPWLFSAKSLNEVRRECDNDQVYQTWCAKRGE